MDSDQKIYNTEVVIIGAGPAGIGAALKFKKQNVPYIILQARNRIGGRVLSHNIDGINVDLGASWIHSYSKKNSLSVHVRQLNVGQVVLTKRQIGRVYMDGQEGQQFDDNTLEIAMANSSYLQKLAKINARKLDKDISIYQAGKQFIENNINKFSAKQKRCTQLLINRLEHYEGSTIKQLSATNFQFRVDQGGDYSPDGTYGQLIKKIVKQNKIQVNLCKIVQKIWYDQQSAKIFCRDGSVYTCKKLISSLPLGVLKSGKVKFQPQLPEQHQNSIKRLGFGLMNKIIVVFQQNFWGSMTWISIGSNERGKYSHIYNFSQKNKNILCCFITDDFARKTQNIQKQVIIQDFLNFLRKLFKVQNLKVKGYAVTKWGKQQFSMGSYTSFHVGSSPQDCYKLRQSIKKTLWIVGQHCYAEHIGTVHGAFKTGQWAAQEVMKTIKWVNPMLKQTKKLINKNEKQPIKKIVKKE